MKPPESRWRLLAMIVVLVGALTLAACGSNDSGDATNASTDSQQTTIASSDPGSAARPLSRRFDPNAPAGQAPNLPKVIAHSLPSDAPLFERLQKGIEAGAEAHGLQTISANADGDPAKQVAQLEGFLQRGVGAIVVTPTDPKAIQDVLQRAIDQGIAVFGFNVEPATDFGGADQYSIGHAAGLDAAKFIEEKLGGRAEVAILHEDSYQPLIARHQGWKDGVLTAGSGVHIVFEAEPKKLTAEAAADAMNTALQAHPGINVVLSTGFGAFGALSALEAAGKDPATTYVSGNDGDAPNLAELKKPNSLYKADFAYSLEAGGYAWATFAADWLDGKSIPQVTSYKEVPLTSPAALRAFETLTSDPAKAWENRDQYLQFLGNISWETRKNYINYPWAPVHPASK